MLKRNERLVGLANTGKRQYHFSRLYRNLNFTHLSFKLSINKKFPAQLYKYNNANACYSLKFYFT